MREWAEQLMRSLAKWSRAKYKGQGQSAKSENSILN